MKRPKLNITIQDIQQEIKTSNASNVEYELRKMREYRRSNSEGRYVQQNRTAKNTSKSGYRGVYKDKNVLRRHNFWMAQIRRKGKCHYLGHFETKEEAARARDKAAKAIYGELAILNFPDE
uniref:Putative HNH endonuclease n=1 Tax=viral metagenome TaxID=1070528 RepID=A0A6M3J0L8_9ZZZZ